MKFKQFPASPWLPFIACLQLVISTAVSAMPAGHANAIAGYGQTSLRFEQNIGQTDSNVRYLTQGSGYSMAFTPTEMVLALDVSTNADSANFANRHPAPHDRPQAHQFGLVHLSFAGANTNAELSPEQTLPEKINYLLGNDPTGWRTGVSAFGRVHYHDLYPGIDLNFHGNQTMLEYDYVVSPGTDASVIQLNMTGADHAGVEADGSLAISVGGRMAHFKKPVAYQMTGGVRHEVTCEFHLHGNQLGFELGSYDHGSSLVIDPVLSYSTFLGGSAQSSAWGLAIDSHDNAYICGWAAPSSSSAATSGAFQTNNRAVSSLRLFPLENCFVAKLDKTGTNLVYYTYLGSTVSDAAVGIAADAQGNAYVTGYTYGQDFPVTTNGLITTNLSYYVDSYGYFAGHVQGFMSKLSADGSQLVYSTYLGTDTGAYPGAIAVDSQDNIYVGGQAYNDYPVTNAIQSTSKTYSNYAGDSYPDAYDAFITEISSNGQSRVYSTFYGGYEEEYVSSIALDKSGNLYAVGETRSTDFPVTNAIQTTYGGGTYNAFALKLDHTGTNVIYATYLGGNVNDWANGVGSDTNGNAYIVGTTFSANFPITNALLSVINGNGSTSVSDGFLTKLSPSGQLLYSTYLGGSQSDIANGVAVQADGEVVVAGQTGSTDFAPYANYGSVNSGNLDAFVARLNSAGNVLENFAYLGGSQEDSANAVALDANANAYVAGYTYSTDYPVTGTNVVQPVFKSGSDSAFVTKLYFEPNQLGTTVGTTWQNTNVWPIIGPPAVLAASNVWNAASLIPSLSRNGVTSLANDRFQRGVSYDPTFASFIIPLTQQTGFRLDDLGNNSENFGGGFPWFTRLTNDVRTHLSLLSSTNVAGIATNYYGYATNFNNPIAAFGATAGGSTLYVNQQVKFGVYCGAQYETTNGIGTNFATPLRILVYNLSSFTPGQTNLIAPIATNYIAIPRRTIAIDATNWLQFATNGFSLTTNAYGLSTTIQLAAENGGAWGVVPQFTNAQSSTYVITHECTTNMGCGYVVEGIGTVPLSTNLYPMVTNSAGTVGWDRLYSLDFQTRPAWRSVFVGQPQFNGTPMPSFYQGASPSELTNLNAVVTNALTLTNGIFSAINDSPELLDNPLLDQLATNLNNDPIAIANYVQNQIELTDALAYNPNNGQASAAVVNEGGVNRSALDVYLEGQGSPVEQCSLLVYLLRQAGYSAAYVFPTNNNVQMLDSRLSTLLRMQLHGAVNQYGQLYTTNTLITVNYPWVAVTISNQTVHLFPWLKDTQITEGLNLYDYMPTNYDNGFKWLSHYLYGDTNILGLSQESDAPSVLFPRFIKQQLLTNAPGISVDDIGLTAFNRQNYYSRWQDFPTPSVVSNLVQVGVVDSLTDITNVWPAMTNMFDTVTLTVCSQANTNTQMTVGPLRMADLHNREMYLATNGAGGLTLWLASYVPGNTNQSAFTTADPFMTNCQSATLTISTNDSLFNLSLTHCRNQAINFSPTNQYLGVTETLQFATPNRPFNAADITAVCFNVGRVTPAMINVHAQAFQQTSYQWSLNTNQTPSVASYQALAAYMMGMDYYAHVSQFLPVCEQLHKTQVISWYAEGLSRLTSEQLGAQNFMRPSMDMFYSEMAHAGNGTSHPDSGNDPLAGTDDFSSLMDGEIAAQEHSIINGYYQSANSVSAVVLLRLAQQRTTNGAAGIIELNRNNYLTVGATNAAGYGQTPLALYDTNIWTAVLNAFNGWDADYVRAYITPGPVSLQAAAYRGMGLVVVGKSQSASIISVNMNGVLGQNSLFFADTPAALSTVYASGANPQDSLSASTSLDASSSYGLYNTGGDLYYGASPSSGSSADYFWTAPDWYGGSFYIWPYVMPANRYEITATFTPPSQVNLSQQINDLYHFPQSTPVATSLTHALDSGNTGSPTWKNAAKYVADPVNVLSGEFYHTAVDLTLAGPQPLQLRRNYSSQNQDDRNGFGYGWDINVVPYIEITTNATATATNVILTAVELDGSVIAYRQQAGNTNLYLPNLANNPQLDNDGNGRIGSIYNPFNAGVTHSFSGTNELYTLAQADGGLRTYVVRSFPVSTPTNTVSRTRPYLTNWQDTQGNAWTFSYGTDSTQPNYGSVTRIQCGNGNYLGLDYNAGGYVSEAYTSSGERASYQYDDFGDLVLAVRPDGSEETYEYQHTQYTNSGTTYVDSTHLLVEEFKPDGRVLENIYDSQRRVTNQLATVGTDLNLYTNAIFTYANNFSITNSYTNFVSGYTVIQDVNGNTCRYDYTNSMVTTNTDQLGQKVIQTWYADNATAPGYPRSLYQTRDKRGLWTQYQYDSHGNLTNAYSWGDLTGDGTLQYATNTASYNANNLPVQITDPAGNSVQTAYHPQYPYLPQYVIFAPGGTPTATNQFAYGNVTNVVVNGNLTLTNVALGVLQQEIIAVNSPDAATNQWSFDGRGYLTQSVQFTGTGDPAVTNYFTCDDQGDVIQRTDAAGQTSEFSFDAMRRPTGHEVFAAGQSVPMFSEFAYYNENGELQWYQGPRSNPADYQWHDYDGAGRLTTDIRWRAEAKADGTGLEAPAGNNLYAQTSCQFDKFGNLLLTVDPRGAMTTNRWDALGQLVQRQHLDTNGTTLLSSEGFAYEPGGLVAYYTNALGGVTTNLYTTNGLPKLSVYPDGSTNAWRYYLDGRIKREVQSNGAYWQTTYDDANRIITHVFYSAAGTPEATNSVRLDRRGNVIRRVDEGGNAFTTVYDGLNRVKATAGPAIVTVSVLPQGINPGGPLSYVTNVLQQAGTNFYDAAGLVTTNINAAGEAAVSWFDALGRVTQTKLFGATGALIRQSSLAYAPDFSSVTVTNGAGSGAIVNTVYADNDGQNVLSIAYPSPGVSEFNLNQYDLAGNLVVQQHDSSAGGTITTWTTATFAYDGLNRLVAKYDRDNAFTTYAYDAMGNLTNRTLPGTAPNVQMLASYNNAGQKLKDWLVSGTSGTRTNAYAYFAGGSPFAGLLQTRIDGRLTTNAYSYDDRFRVTSQAATGLLPEQNLTTAWQYDPRGYVTNYSEQFASTNTGPTTSVQRTFDPYGQMATESVNGGAFSYGASQSWDATGRRSALNVGGASYGYAWQADGSLIYASNPTANGTYSYNTAGLLTNRLVHGRNTAVTSRDGEGRPLTIATTVNTLPQLGETLAWSGDGLLTNHTLVRGDFTDNRVYAYANLSRRLTQEQLNLNASTTWTNSFVYDRGVAGGPGALTTDGPIGASFGLWWSGIPDAFSRVNTETNNAIGCLAYGHVNGQSTLSAWLDNQPIQILDVGTNNMQWRTFIELSQGMHQLKVSALHPSGFYTAWATNTFTNSITNQVTFDSYDFSGNVTNRVYRNASGSTNRTQFLSYDAKGRLRLVMMRNTNNYGFNWSAVYDGLDRRIATITTLVSNGVPSTVPPQTLNSYYDPQAQFLELGLTLSSAPETEFLQAGTSPSIQTVWKLYGPDANGVFGGLNGTGGFEGVSPYINTFNPNISDARGNVLAEVTNGVASWTLARQAAYGSVPGYTPVAFGNGVDFTKSAVWHGREVDVTGYYHLGMRDYDPVSGQWLTYDPMWNDGDPNGYSFCGGDPADYFDPNGLFSKAVYNNLASDAKSVMKEIGSAMGANSQVQYAGMMRLMGNTKQADMGAERAQPFIDSLNANSQALANLYHANLQVQDGNAFNAANATINPLWGAFAGGYEAGYGLSLNPYSLGNNLNYQQRMNSAGGATVSFINSAAFAYGGFNFAKGIQLPTVRMPAFVAVKDTFVPGELMPNGQIAGMGPGAMLNNEFRRAIAGIAAPGKFDIMTSSLEEARAMIQQAMPDAVELPEAVAGQPYASPPAGVKNWFQVQPAEPEVGNYLPHIKYANWTTGKKGTGGSWGHIFFPESSQ